MTELTLKFETSTLQRLSQVAKLRETTVEDLLVMAADAVIAQADAEQRFRQRAALGAGRNAEGLALLKKATG